MSFISAGSFSAKGEAVITKRRTKKGKQKRGSCWLTGAQCEFTASEVNTAKSFPDDLTTALFPYVPQENAKHPKDNEERRDRWWRKIKRRTVPCCAQEINCEEQ